MKRVFILAQLILAACVILIAAGPQNRYVVLIDAGHGGDDKGISSEKGIDEKELTLDLAQRLGANLENEDGIEVRYTRESDAFLGLKERIALAGGDVDLIISLHADHSASDKMSGMKLYVPTDGLHKAESARLSEVFAAAIDDLDIPYSGVDVANFYVLSHAPCPVLLFSAGYLSNAHDLELLASHSYRDVLAMNLASAVRNGVEK